MWKKEELELEKYPKYGDWVWRNQPLDCRSDKMGEWENQFADWLVELANRGLSLSTDAFLKSAKKSSYSSHENEVKWFIKRHNRSFHGTPRNEGGIKQCQLITNQPALRRSFCFFLWKNDKLNSTKRSNWRRNKTGVGRWLAVLFVFLFCFLSYCKRKRSLYVDLRRLKVPASLGLNLCIKLRYYCCGRILCNIGALQKY